MIYLYKEIKTLKNICSVCLLWRLRQKFWWTWSPVRQPLLLNDLKCNGPNTAASHSGWKCPKDGQNTKKNIFSDLKVENLAEIHFYNVVIVSWVMISHLYYIIQTIQRNIQIKEQKNPNVYIIIIWWLYGKFSWCNLTKYNA